MLKASKGGKDIVKIFNVTVSGSSLILCSHDKNVIWTLVPCSTVMSRMLKMNSFYLIFFHFVIFFFSELYSF